MRFEDSKRFGYGIDTAWKALLMVNRLDIEPGSRVEIVSDDEWRAYATGLLGKDISCTMYRASFDEGSRCVTVIGNRNTKKENDTIKLYLEEDGDTDVILHMEMKIGFGGNPLAKAIGKMMKGQMCDVMTKSIFENFEALCREAEQMS